MRAQLPPGPSLPAFVQGVGFWSRPLAFLERVWSADLGHSHVGFKMTHRQNEAVLAAVLRDG